MREFEIVHPSMFTEPYPPHIQSHDIPLRTRFSSPKGHTIPLLGGNEAAHSVDHGTRLLPSQSAALPNGIDVEETSTIQDQTAAWKPGFWRRLPALGLINLVGVLLCKCH